MKKVTWVLIKCNSQEEADKIGNKLLQSRLVACFDIYDRAKASYFWPPQSGKIESTKGSLLIGETLEKKVEEIITSVKELHSDDLPFIGSTDYNVEDKFYNWVKDELNG